MGEHLILMLITSVETFLEQNKQKTNKKQTKNKQKTNKKQTKNMERGSGSLVWSMLFFNVNHEQDSYKLHHRILSQGNRQNKQERIQSTDLERELGAWIWIIGLEHLILMLIMSMETFLEQKTNKKQTKNKQKTNKKQTKNKQKNKQKTNKKQTKNMERGSGSLVWSMLFFNVNHEQDSYKLHHR